MHVMKKNRINIHILGVSETQWIGSGTDKTSPKVFHYSGKNDPEHRNEVRILMSVNLDAAVTRFVLLSE